MYVQQDLKHILIPAGSSILDPFQYFLKFSNSSHTEGNTVFLKDTLISIEDISDKNENNEEVDKKIRFYEKETEVSDYKMSETSVF